jgi:hypothetical protein
MSGAQYSPLGVKNAGRAFLFSRDDSKKNHKAWQIIRDIFTKNVLR